MEKADFQAQMKDRNAGIEAVLRRYLPEEGGYQKRVLEAMNYSMTAGGKRLRPMLMQETYRIFGGKDTVIEPFMAAIEMIHTYSLVHDDLPAMDNDEYRRGRRTTWSVYGEGFGVLAGDGLLNYAFETAMTAFPGICAEEKTAGGAEGSLLMGRMRALCRALQVLARKAGVYGMIGGQSADIEAENQTEKLSAEQILFIHEHKTAALIQASMMIGAILAGAEEEAVARVEKCAYNIGIAFQIQDDILDVIGDSAELGKPVGSDADNNKQTYVTLNGLEQSQADVAALSQEAVDILREFPGDTDFLEMLVNDLIHRRR